MEASPGFQSPPVDARSALFSIQIEIASDMVAVIVGGELDMCTGDRLVESVGSFVSHGPERVLLDLEGVTFIDSSGIRALTRLAEMTRQSGGVIEITNCSATVEKILAMCEILAPGSRVPSLAE